MSHELFFLNNVSKVKSVAWQQAKAIIDTFFFLFSSNKKWVGGLGTETCHVLFEWPVIESSNLILIHYDNWKLMISEAESNHYQISFKFTKSIRIFFDQLLQGYWLIEQTLIGIH